MTTQGEGVSMRSPTWLAFVFGTLNTIVFLLAMVRAEIADLLMSGLLWAVLLLWVLAIYGAEWALSGVDTRRGAPGDSARLLVRGGIAGALVGALTAAALVLPSFEGIAIALPFGAALGVAFGVACAALDIVLLALGRMLTPGHVPR